MMAKLRILVLPFAALLALVVNAQTPAAGRIAGHSYVNANLHISYTWPAMLQPSIPSAPTDPNSYEFPLLIARQGNQPFGIVVIAQKLNVAGPHSSSLKTSADLIDRLQRSLQPGPILSNFTRTQKKSAQGRVFDELGYTQSGKPAVVIATQVGQYLIVFKCNAASAQDLANMRNSAYALRATN